MPSIHSAPVSALDVADGGERPAHRRGRRQVERVVLRLDLAAGAGERPAGVALRHEAAHAHRSRGGEQVVGPFRAQAVRLREAAVEAAQVERAGERGELVDDRVGRRVGDRAGDRLAVERIEHDGRGAERADGVAFGGAPRRSGHLVAGCDEPGDQLLSERSGGARDEDLHGISSGGTHR
jgi:hypothetical protein